MSIASWVVLSCIGLMMLLGAYSWWDDRAERRELERASRLLPDAARMDLVGSSAG